MKRIFTIYIVSMLLLLSCFTISTATNENNTIYVDDDGTADYTSIQDAVDAASDGDTIYVYSGTYYENIVIQKSILLQGEEKTSTIIDGGKKEGHCIEIFSDSISISEFTIQNSKCRYNGITIYSSYNTIENNIIQNNGRDAIFISSGGTDSYYRSAPRHNLIRRNIIRNNEDKGISLWGGEIFLPHFRNIHISLNAINTTIMYNIIEGNNHGVYLAADTRGTLVILNEFKANNISVAPMHTFFNKILKNNFLGSEPFFQSGKNEWDENYWGQILDAPKRITGRIGYFGILPWFNYDKHPAADPYAIER